MAGGVMKEKIYEKMRYWKGQKEKALDRYLISGNKVDRESAIRCKARAEILEEVYEIVKSEV